MPLAPPRPAPANYPQPAQEMFAFLHAVDMGAEVPDTPWQRAARSAANAHGHLAQNGTLTSAGYEQLAKFREAQVMAEVRSLELTDVRTVVREIRAGAHPMIPVQVADKIETLISAAALASRS
jgi:hypothetical protein